MERDFRIRKLTPRECFRLMDVKEEDIDKIQEAGISNSQQYKLAGNSIVVSVLEGVFRQMFRPVYIKPTVARSVSKKAVDEPKAETVHQVTLDELLAEDDD